MTLLNMGPDDQPQVFGRVVPAGSDENAVYMRSLRPGEEDSGEAVHVPAGKRLVIRAGDLVVQLKRDRREESEGAWWIRPGGRYDMDVVQASRR